MSGNRPELHDKKTLEIFAGEKERLSRQASLMVGHSNHPWAKFADLLTSHDVRALIDARSFPRSRYSPQFNGTAMRTSLAAIGIEYRHAPALGGKDPRPADELSEHIATLLPLEVGTAMMCSEGDFRKCHRHQLLAPVLIELGVGVRQIMQDGSLVEDTGPAAELFAS